MKNICRLLSIACLLGASHAQAQLFTFQGRVNYSIRQFENRFKVGDLVTGYIDFQNVVQEPFPGLKIYGIKAGASINGESLFHLENGLGSMTNASAANPLEQDGWGANQVVPLGDTNGFFTLLMTTSHDIMSGPENPPNDIPIDWFYNAVGVYFIYPADTWVDPIADVRWDITSYHFYAPGEPVPTPVPESSALPVAAAATAAALCVFRWKRRRARSTEAPN